MPIPPEQEQSPKAPLRSVTIKPPADWICLLIAGVGCVYLAGGDLSRVGDQLIGAGLTAFKIAVDERTKNK